MSEVNTEKNASLVPVAKPAEKPKEVTESEARVIVSKLPLKNLDVKMLYEVMQIPSCSRNEFRMATFIMLWARKHGIKHVMDKKGNVYLTKGELSDGEYYPCVTSHMDTVQDKAKVYALAGAELPLKTRKTMKTSTNEVRHEVFIDGQGIGADDKLGVLISLQLMLKTEKIKAAFFVEEEIGMLGSAQLDVDFFNDVAYVIGWDSPDILRAAWKCSGTKLFTYDFYTQKLKPIVEKWDFTDKCFKSEPYTDVVNIRSKTGVMCMNFGNGGYNAHANNEYLVLEDVDHAIGMGEDIIKGLGNKERFVTEKEKSTHAYQYQYSNSNDADEVKLGKLFGTTYYSSTYGSYNGSTQTNNRTNNTFASGNNTVKSGISEKAVKYIVDTYEAYIASLKESMLEMAEKADEELKARLEEIGMDKESVVLDLKSKIEETFSKDIKF